MSDHAAHPTTPRSWIVPMRARSPEEAHRASTPLELLFDLVFVIAVSQASSHLHHGIIEGHAVESVLSFTMLFFALWWAWSSFSWFASAYDTDDVPYRIAVFVQLTGALIIATGISQAFEGDYRIVTLGYLVMRLAGVAQWLRAAHADPSHRSTSYRYAIGITLVQAGWLARLLLPQGWQLPAFGVLVVAEFAVPIWAEYVKRTTWHHEHIAERYGLFTIIVLGEAFVSASLGIQSALEIGDLDGQLTSIIIGGLLIIFAMWWLYFDQPPLDLGTLNKALVWGYGHLVIFASAAAVGAGLAVAVDYASHHAEIGQFEAGAAVAVPVALYVLSLWYLNQRARVPTTVQRWLPPFVILLVLMMPFTSQATLLIGLLLAAMLTVKIVVKHRVSPQHAV